MAATLKLVHGERTHFVTLDSDDFSSAGLAIRSVLPESDGWLAKYTDEDGDLCVLAEATWQDFLETARANSDDGALRLEVMALSGMPSLGNAVREFGSLNSEADSDKASQCSDLSESSWQIVDMGDIAEEDNPAGEHEDEGIASATSATFLIDNVDSYGGLEEAQIHKDKRAASPGEEGGAPAHTSVGWPGYAFLKPSPQESSKLGLVDPAPKAEQGLALTSTEEESEESNECNTSGMTLADGLTVEQEKRSEKVLQRENETFGATQSEDYDDEAEEKHEDRMKGLGSQLELRVDGCMLLQTDKGIKELDGDSTPRGIPRQASAPNTQSEMGGSVSRCEEDYADHGVVEETQSAQEPHSYAHEAGTQIHVGVTCDVYEATPIIGPCLNCEHCHDYDLCGSCQMRCAESHDADHRFRSILQPRGARTQVHKRVTCDGCGVAPIVGPRFKCETCANYDLCGACYSKRAELHNADHELQSPTHGRKSRKQHEQSPKAHLLPFVLSVGGLATMFGPWALLACPLMAVAAKHCNECDKHRKE